MLTSQRKQLILEALERDGQVIAKTLSLTFDVSEDTIRRDLRELAAEGQLQRVHGGALPASSAAVDFAGREQIESASKAAIGRAAAGLIGRGQIAFIDGGTTAVQLARHLPRDLQATIVTHSPSIAVELAEHAALEVIMIGGRLFRHSMVNVGAAAIEALSHIRADLYFMGVTGVHPQAGLSTGDMEEAYVKRALVSMRRKRWCWRRRKNSMRRRRTGLRTCRRPARSSSRRTRPRCSLRRSTHWASRSCGRDKAL